MDTPQWTLPATATATAPAPALAMGAITDAEWDEAFAQVDACFDKYQATRDLVYGEQSRRLWCFRLWFPTLAFLILTSLIGVVTSTWLTIDYAVRVPDNGTLAHPHMRPEYMADALYASEVSLSVCIAVAVLSVLSFVLTRRHIDAYHDAREAHDDRFRVSLARFAADFLQDPYGLAYTKFEYDYYVKPRECFVVSDRAFEKNIERVKLRFFQNTGLVADKWSTAMAAQFAPWIYAGNDKIRYDLMQLHLTTPIPRQHWAAIALTLGLAVDRCGNDEIRFPGFMGRD